jgi:hypothetical protein
MIVKFESEINKFIKDLSRHERKQRKKGAAVIRNEIKRRARAVKIKGNLEKGVYQSNTENASFVGTHAPGYQNFLVEFGHFIGKKGSTDRKWVKPHPIVYPSFEAKAAECERIMSEQVP